MGINKKYSGYQSFDYLEKGKDFKEFKLLEGQNAFEPHPVPLSAAQEERVKRLAEELVLISLHEHPFIFPADVRETFAYVREARTFTAYEELSNSCWDAVFDNFMDGVNMITSKNGWKWNDVLYDVGMRLCDLAHQDFLIRAERVEDIYRAHDEGKIALIPSIEGAAMIENELDRIEILYGFGIRVLGITYSESNSLGTGLKEQQDGGLTSFGRQAVERMNKVGMAIDCAHASDKTTLDTIEASTKPIFLTHTGARGLWDSKRLATDKAIKACAGKGGVIGIEAAPHTNLSPQNPRHSIESFMDHFEYVKDLVGEDHVAFGPDTLYGDHVGLHKAFAASLSIGQTQQSQSGGQGKKPQFEKVEYVKGIENPTEGSHNILRWLVKNGYSDGTIAKVMGQNILRVLKDVWH